jgi:hypothetical protein
VAAGVLPPDRLEGVLVEPFLGPAGARRGLQELSAAKVPRALLPLGLLAEMDEEDRAGLSLAGAVDLPWGGSTLASKRMGLLECVRLEASGAVVALTPFWLAEGGHGDRLLREVEALLATAPELPVRLLLPPFPLEEDRWGLLLRLLSDRRPRGIVVPEEALGEKGRERLVAVRKRLPRKVHLEVLLQESGPEGAEALLSGGADGLLARGAAALCGGGR